MLHFAVYRRNRLNSRQAQDHIQQLVHTFVDFAFADCPLLDRIHQLQRRIGSGHRHFQIHACTDTFNIAVASAPVRDHHAAVSPLTAKDLLEQVRIFIGIGSVETVVAGHEAARSAFFNGNFKIRQVQLAQRSFIHDGVGMHSEHFLAVGRKMLGACRNAVGLDAADISRSQFACKVWIFGIVFKAAAAQT